MGPNTIEWRSINNGAWHIFIGKKSICNRAYSNGEFEFTDSPKKSDDKCKFCIKLAGLLKERIQTITAGI